ncbi:MAG: hypothetical protein JO006_01970 [Paucibacter sp.]|nr:hypothetical protein [Roseateles sp.]
MSSRFQTLMLREWMQHKRGWLVTLLAPPLLFLALLPFGTVPEGEINGMAMDKSLAIGVAAVIFSMTSMFLLAMTSALFQLPGLARRDVQDRSIEFWLSLPASHTESIATTVLTHLLVVPLSIGLLSYVLGYVMAAAAALKFGGVTALAAIPWGAVAGFSLPVVLRLSFGVLLAMLWAAPLVMIVMNASAWLKRWGIPALAGTTVVLCGILPKLYGIDLFRVLLKEQLHGLTHAVVNSGAGFKEHAHELPMPEVAQVTAWAWSDALQAMQALASPNLVGGLALAALGFYGLILRRRRGA